MESVNEKLKQHLQDQERVIDSEAGGDLVLSSGIPKYLTNIRRQRTS